MATPSRSPAHALPLPIIRHTLPRLPTFRRNLWLLLATCVAAFIGIGVQALVFNLYLISIGFREDFLGLFSFANTAGIGFAALLAGRLSSKIGPRQTLLGATLILSASSAALVVSQDSIALLAVAVVNGAALAHIFVTSATFVMDNADPHDRSTAYAGYFAAQSIAMVIGSYLGGALPTALTPGSDATSAGYVFTLVTAAALTAIGIVPMYLADDSRAQGSSASRLQQSSKGDQRRQMRRDMTWIVGSSMLVAASMGFALPFINVFFSERLGATTVDIGLVFALASIAMVVASISGPIVGRRFGVVPTIVVCRGLTAPILVGLAFSPSIGVGAALYIARTLITNLTWPVDNAFTMELVSPERRATLAALRSSSWNFAWALTSGVAGLMIVRIGFTSIFIVSGILMVCGSVAFYVALHSRVTPELGAVSSVATLDSPT